MINYGYPLSEIRSVKSDFINLLIITPKNLTTEVAFKAWSLRTIIAHFIEWDKYTCSMINFMRQLKTPPSIEYIDFFNEEARRYWNISKPWSDLVIAFKDGSFNVINEYYLIHGELRYAPIWPESNFTLAKWLTNDVKHHKRHLSEIKGFLKAKGVKID
jgi:hypothetical protein